MRIFIALPLPDSVKKLLGKAQGRNEAIRWQSPDNFHITLQFVGELSAAEIKILTETLADFNQPVFSLALHGWGTFPAKGRPRIIWAGVEPVNPVLKLHTIIRDKCHQLGFETPSGGQPYVPHITLGRVSRRLERKDIKKMLDKPIGNAHEFLVDRFAVYKSENMPGGAYHTIIKEYLLAF